MKRKYAVGFLITTALVPVQAQADPVSAFLAGVSAFTSGSLGALTTGVLTYSGVSAAAFSAGVFAGAVGGSLVGKVLLGIGLSALAAQFVPTPALPKPSATMGNFAQPVSYAEWVFGKTRKGGPLGFTRAKGSKRHYVVILAAHECEGIVQHWFDELTVGLNPAITDYDSSNIITSAQDSEYTLPGVATGRGRIDVFLGAPAQTANAGFVATFDDVDSDFDFEGLCGAHLWASKVPPQDFADIYPNGRQWAWTPVLDGNNQIYDPRDDSYKWTANAALCMAFWITEILGGEVDWDEVGEEADACDVTVTTAAETTIPKWEINGTLSDDQSFETQRAQMAGSCDAFMYERSDGKIGFKVGRWIEPTVTLTGADAISIELVEGQWGADAPTEVAVQYIEPTNAWRETPAGVWVEDAVSRRVRDEPQMYLVRYHNQAARLAKRIAKARRPEATLKATIGLIGYELIGERFFYYQHPASGELLSFEVGKLTRVSRTLFELEAVSVKETDFDFDAETEEPDQPEFQIVRGSYLNDPVENLAAEAEANRVIHITWDAVEDFQAVQIRWVESGETDYTILTFSDGETSTRITVPTAGTTYEIDARTVNRLTNGDPSAWAPDPALEVVSAENVTPPAAVTSLTTSVISGSAPWTVRLDFDTANDPNQARVHLYRGSTATFASATQIATIYLGPNASGTYNDSGLANGPYYWWAVAANAGGVEGTETGPENEFLS